MQISQQHPLVERQAVTGVVTPAPIYILATLVFSATLAYAATTWDGRVATPVTLDPGSSNAPGIAIDLLTARAQLPLANDWSAGSGFVEFEPPPSEPSSILGLVQTPATEPAHESRNEAN